MAKPKIVCLLFSILVHYQIAVKYLFNFGESLEIVLIIIINYRFSTNFSCRNSLPNELRYGYYHLKHREATKCSLHYNRLKTKSILCLKLVNVKPYTWLIRSFTCPPYSFLKPIKTVVLDVNSYNCIIQNYLEEILNIGLK